ncbi:hypothetical protein QCA50_017825 [Cerrena zonata]|uniref:Uncharacterized protein n=1 Tax=Cerrena zonata TaxID=2478898 RepID=A0AAW0FIS6_9APHY
MRNENLQLQLTDDGFDRRAQAQRVILVPRVTLLQLDSQSVSSLIVLSLEMLTLIWKCLTEMIFGSQVLM